MRGIEDQQQQERPPIRKERGGNPEREWRNWPPDRVPRKDRPSEPPEPNKPLPPDPTPRHGEPVEP